MSKLPKDLDFANMEALIRWVHSITEATPIYERGSVYDAVEIFEQHGYMREFTPPPERDVNNADAYGRWIIAQALQDLDYYRGDHVRGVISKFTTKWLDLHATQG